jgi:MFS family permease
VFVVAASIVAGAISDRSGHHVALTVAAAIVQGVAALLIAALPGFETTSPPRRSSASGTAYMSVGLALATDLLPFPDDSARDLGFVNVSAALGQLLGPVLGAGLVALVGGFWLLFVVGGALSIVGGMTLAIAAAGPSTP